MKPTAAAAGLRLEKDSPTTLEFVRFFLFIRKGEERCKLFLKDFALAIDKGGGRR